MNRWTPAAAAGLAAAALAATAQTTTDVQTRTQVIAAPQAIQREVPRDVRPARMTVTLPPQVLLGDRPDRLSPGARIRGVNNMLVLSGSIAGQTLPVVYRRDAAGLVHEVWLLSEDEFSRLGRLGIAEDGEGVRRFNELLAAIFAARR